MNLRFSALCLAILGGIGALGTSSTAQAGNVGYYKGCPDSGDISGVVTAAGHTKVDVATLNEASLSGLSALVITVCPRGYESNAAVNQAVANGMGLVFERLWFFLDPIQHQDSSQLPGAPTFSSSRMEAYPEANNIEVAAGAPILSGPGGTLTSTSLDRLVIIPNQVFSMVFWYPTAALPAGAIPFLTTSNPGHVGAFAYTVGRGRVVYTDSQWTLQLPGTLHTNTESFAAGGATFLSNAISWAAMGNPTPATTCASEGYTGTKLTWCQNICEKGYTGATLNMWIQRWVNKYRDLPYCAREK